LDNKMIAAIAKEYKLNNCDITFREDCNVDQLIDVIEGNVRPDKNSCRRPRAAAKLNLKPLPRRSAAARRHRAVSSPCSGSLKRPAL